MNTTFAKFHRQLGRVTFGMLLAVLSVYVFTLFCALLGFSKAVTSFHGVTMSLACCFAMLFVVFLLSSIAGALIRWSDRKHPVDGAAKSS